MRFVIYGSLALFVSVSTWSTAGAADNSNCGGDHLSLQQFTLPDDDPRYDVRVRYMLLDDEGLPTEVELISACLQGNENSAVFTPSLPLHEPENGGS